MKKVWLFGFYFWQYAAFAFLTPFFVLYYQGLGFNGAQIGLLTGLSPLVTLFAGPLWTGLADATRQHRLVLSLTLAATSLAVLVFPVLRAFVPVLALTVLYSIFLAPISSLADSAAMTTLAKERNMYGRVRLGGTVGFALAAPLAGFLVQRFGLVAAFWGYAVLYWLALGTGQKIWLAAAPLAARNRVSVAGGSRALMTNPRWLLFLVGAVAGGLALTVGNQYLFPYLKSLGASATTMGLALTLGTVLEVPLLFFGHRLLRWLRADRLFWLALLLTGGRLLLMAAASTVNQALACQLLTGLTFPTMWIAGVAYADESAPAGLSATAQGIFGATVFGIGSATGGFAGGLLLTSVGPRAMYLVFGLTVLALVAIMAAGSRLLPPARPKESVSPARVE